MNSLHASRPVMTNGGIIGIITEVRDDEIVLKVDETTNTRRPLHQVRVKTRAQARERAGVVEARSDELSHDERIRGRTAHRMESADVS